MKKSIIKFFAYLENNLGDDLMVEILAERYPQYIFLYCGHHRGSTHLYCKDNVMSLEQVWRKWGRLNHIFNLATLYKKKDFLYRWIGRHINKRTCCTINIGGSIFIEGTNGVEKRMESEEFKLKSPPLFIVGSNFGPWKSPEYYDAYKKYFARCAGVTFRESQSYEMFCKLKNVSCAPDVVLNTKPVFVKTELNHIFISVINLDNRMNLKKYRKDYENFIVKLCRVTTANGDMPTLVSFCSVEGDDVAVDRIYHECKRQNIHAERLFYKDNIEEIKTLYAKSKFVLATRFHSMILALVYEKPFYAISYDDKVKNVLEDLNLKCYCKLEEMVKLVPEKILNNSPEFEEVRRYKEGAKYQFRYLDEFLKDKL